jgi:hypothetical protein
MAFRQQAEFGIRERISENHHERSYEEQRQEAAAEGRGTACRVFGPMSGVAGPGSFKTRSTDSRRPGISDDEAVS